MRIIDKLLVLRLRARLNPSQLDQLDGKTLLAHSIDEAMIGKNSILHSDIGKIRFKDSLATARLLAKGFPLPMHYTYTKENGQWKLDITSILPKASFFMEKAAQGEKVSENQYVLDIIRYSEDRDIGPDIWHPSSITEL